MEVMRCVGDSANLSIDPDTGEISGQFDYDDAETSDGEYNFSITATDTVTSDYDTACTARSSVVSRSISANAWSTC